MATPAATPQQQQYATLPPPTQQQVFEYQLPPALMHADPNCIRVAHRAVMTTKMRYGLWVMGLNTCTCHNAEKALKRTYFEVHENRIEWNYAYPMCCGVRELRGFEHYDKKILQNADKATCCQPFCTHNQVCPTCCDACGEAVVVYASNCVCRVCCKKHWLFQGFANASMVAQEIQKAKMAFPSRQIMG